ncbi:MAG: preprotein translocase subunit SecA, partial [Kutzneria sp.]|nr:preprotein translocase subunit SecA [Kutzneria sp.]
PQEWQAAYQPALAQAMAAVKAEADEVREAGGLYVLGTERHESRRIDNQLRGRSGRQGDPGESRFYLSLGDELMRRFNAAMVEVAMTRLRVPEDVPIEHKLVTRAIRSAQTQVEQQNFEIRKNVLKYDEVMNQQRKVIYAERRRVLEGEDLREQVQKMIADTAAAYVNGATASGYAEDWDHEKLWTALKTLYPVSLSWERLLEEDEDLTADRLLEAVQRDASAAYAAREAEIDGKVGEGAMRELERRVVLSVLDRKWREHLYEMDYLKEGIGLRAMAQRDPLVEYQREGFDMFNGMLDGLKEESVGFLFNLQVEAAEPAEPVAAPAAAVPVAFGNGATGGAVAPPPQPDAGSKVPPALRGKGLGAQEQQRLSYSGPAEGGGVHARQDGGDGNGDGGTRRERRAAARSQSKTGRKRH